MKILVLLSLVLSVTAFADDSSNENIKCFVSTHEKYIEMKQGEDETTFKASTSLYDVESFIYSVEKGVALRITNKSTGTVTVSTASVLKRVASLDAGKDEPLQLTIYNFKNRKLHIGAHCFVISR